MIEQLGKYRIDGTLGQGAMGVVYKAFDPLIERVVALKAIRKELFSDGQRADLIARFKHEAQAAGRLNHPNIVMVHDYGEDAESAYIVMEFVEGAPLNALMVPARPAALEHTVAWMSDLLLALDYAHSRGIVHRDIKPANLMITSNAQLKVGDFGVARLDSALPTQTELLIGSPGYMSPEQFMGEPIDGRSDVFAAGVVLYELLTGTRPFLGSASTVMHQVLNLEPVAPSQLVPSLGTAYDEIIVRALAKNAAQRFDSARAFLTAFTAAQHDCPSDPAATVPLNKRRTDLATATAARAAEHAIDVASLQEWKRESFPELEIMLSRHIGPMAQVLMRKVALKAESLDDVVILLLPQIPSEHDKAQFQEAVALARRKLDASGTSTGRRFNPGVGSLHGAAKVTAPGHAEGRTAIRAPITFDEAYVTAVTGLLLVFIGPIARVISKRAAKQTVDRAELIELIARQIDSAPDRASFLAQAELL